MLEHIESWHFRSDSFLGGRSGEGQVRMFETEGIHCKGFHLFGLSDMDRYVFSKEKSNETGGF